MIIFYYQSGKNKLKFIKNEILVCRIIYIMYFLFCDLKY